MGVSALKDPAQDGPYAQGRGVDLGERIELRIHGNTVKFLVRLTAEEFESLHRVWDADSTLAMRFKPEHEVFEISVQKENGDSATANVPGKFSPELSTAFPREEGEAINNVFFDRESALLTVQVTFLVPRGYVPPPIADAASLYR